MYCKSLFTCVALLLAAAPALAMDAKTCQAESAKKPSAERSAFMKKCLSDLSEPTHVKEVQQQEKNARCEQNAKNQKLQGNDKGNYVASCMSKNEAAEAAKAAPVQTAGEAPAPAKPKAASSHAAEKAGKGTANSCVKQANKKGLKGDARAQFLKTCKPS